MLYSSVTPVLVLVFAILAVALFSTFERKLIGLVQIRLGPEKVSLLGIIQPFADAANLFGKEELSPEESNSFSFYLPSFLLFTMSVVMWFLFPSEEGFFQWSNSSFFLLLLFSISVYSVIVMGWYSNSKFAALGCVRSSVQTISYEVGIALGVIFLSLSYNSPTIESWCNIQRDVVGVFWMPFIFFFFFFTFLVEINRSPFDLSEGESELVSGFCVEYGGIGYTFIFLGENLSLLWVGVLLSTFFFSGSIVGLSVLLFLIVWVRASLPRIRFDNLILFFWVELLPLFLGVVGLYLIFF